ncbi:calcium-binding protein [Parvularcula marina]|uniref:RapA2 cadherin-like domain-containing protein n=1 Tax=Parvularcula marina TaxID=2292771 RepID=A0A371R8B3_9PROT|nr:Ig-like domain-containing protein [Parvularcula marina]RFB01685.1 hypothetical protein DX908_15560 [Parvularcula marina]
MANIIGDDTSETFPGLGEDLSGDDNVDGRGGHDLIYLLEGQDFGQGGKGKDTIFGGGGADTIKGQGGDDILSGDDGPLDESSVEGADLIYGGGGNDIIRGQGNDDTIDGQGGNDTICGDSGDDVIFGGDHHDLLLGAGGDDNIDGGFNRDTIDGADGDDTLKGGGGIDLLFGGSGADILSGNNADDTLLGQDGSDTIYGGNANDLVFGGAGVDTIKGQKDDDTLVGGDEIGQGDDITGNEGDDLIFGQAGEDNLQGGDGQDTILGGLDDDDIDGGKDEDVLFGNEGDDDVDGSAGDDKIFGGAGNDSLSGNDDDDFIEGEGGDDDIRGGQGNDTMLGGAGDDSISGSDAFDVESGFFGDDGNDVIFGEGGADVLEGVNGDDYIDGGDDNDDITGGDGNDTLFGGEGADTVAGGLGADAIDGGNAVDLLAGNEGDDTILGGAGDDTIDGGADDDCLDGEAGADNIAGGLGHDTIDGDAGNDTISGGDGDDVIQAGNGDDVVDGGAGDDIIDAGNAGTDYVYDVGMDGVFGTEDDIAIGGDTVLGGTGNDTLIGSGTGDYTLDGEEDDDFILGGNTVTTGFDLLFGGEHDDTLAGRQGQNYLYGEEGADDFIIDIVVTTSTDGMGNVTVDSIDANGLFQTFIMDFDGNQSDQICFNVTYTDGSDALTGNITNKLFAVLDDYINYFSVDVLDYTPVELYEEGGLTFTDNDLAIQFANGSFVWIRDVSQNTVFELGEVQTLNPNTGSPFSFQGFWQTDEELITFGVDKYEDLTVDDLEKVFLQFVRPTMDPGSFVAPEPDFEVPNSFKIRPEDDDATTDENIIVTGDLFDNDISVFGETLTVENPGVYLYDGASVLPNEDAMLTVNPDGTWSFDQKDAFDFLAVGEMDMITFVYTSTDGLVSSVEKTLKIVINGVNDLVTIESTDDGSVIEEDGGVTLTDTGNIGFGDVDLSDTHTTSAVFKSTTNPGGQLGGLVSSLVMDTTGLGDGGWVRWDYALDDDLVQFLADGETITEVYTVTIDDGNGGAATTDVSITIFGTNDEPIAQDVMVSVSEDALNVTGMFNASDVDATDILSYQILGLPMDEFGHQYGEVVNNGDGTFTFNLITDPSGNNQFQFLEAGETRDMTFQYVAIDDSGTPTDTSEAKTITVTVVGADDADIDFTDDLVFVTEGQSQFGTGDAIILDPDLPFLGIDEYTSLSTTILGGQTFAGGVLQSILEGIGSVVDALEDLGCAVVDFFGGDCEDDDVPTSISVPSVRTVGGLDVKAGLQPYFYLNSGSVDANLPVEVVFTVPRQVEAGDTFTIGSAYTLDGGATFSTMSPQVSFGLDFVFDLDTSLDLYVGSTKIDIFDFDTGDIDGFKGNQGEPGFNIFNFPDPSENELEFDLAGFGTLSFNAPVINTTGVPVDPDTLRNLDPDQKTDDIASLSIDIDAIIAEGISAALGGAPVTFGESGSFGLTTSVAGVNLNLISVEYGFDLIAIDLIATLAAIQDFELTIEDLPLLLTLEDGSTITGYNVGDDITVTAPTGFDVDTMGDADGLIDFTIDVDMDAVFSNLTQLGFSLELFIGLLRFTAGITSDFFNGPSFSLFPNSTSTTDDDFAFDETFTFIDNEPFATIFPIPNDSPPFDLEGFDENPATENTTYIEVDIA